jgi:hypothetical protein
VPISTQLGAVTTLPTVLEPFALSCHGSSSGSYHSPSYTNQGIPPTVSLTGLHQFDQQLQCVNASHVTAQELQEALLLQQQQAEVDSAINNMLALRQQLAAIRNPPAYPTATPVSRATAALGLTPQFNLECVPVGPRPASPAAATEARGPFSVGAGAVAQMQLAQLQAQQQQLLSVQQQLQLELQAQMARLLAMV